MTLSFAGILPEYLRHYSRGIMLKNVAKTPYLTLGLTLEMTLDFGSYLKAEMSVLTRVTDRLQKLISSFFFSPFHKNSRLFLDVVSTSTFFIGMAHSLSLSAVTIKKALL
ncbi:hypothetical protein GO495_30010 [Chitinophaga oryziterrae]|uniref:Uncharacterized protein n=2 Tax=Chitinophaga oryziterrae TaxID=1031224 RepID=A0A6N8JHT3_9BACT|nr:hypothetical protein [Chitinophaga oryziterrae]